MMAKLGEKPESGFFKEQLEAERWISVEKTELKNDIVIS